jgi:serine/threonine-protein kinase
MSEPAKPARTLDYGARALNDAALAATVAGAASEQPAAREATSVAEAFSRTTVLPSSTRNTRDVTPVPSTGPRFETVQRLGEGGAGEVVLVQDHDIQRKVAIKRLRPDMRSDAAMRRFADEVRIVGQLEHPNITPVHDVGMDATGQPYFVMKYVAGDTLEAVINRLKAHDPATVERFPYVRRVEIFLDVLHAISYAHARGIVHRDLKPSNIMVGPYGEVTVMDWGIAKRTAEGRASNEGVESVAPGTDVPARPAGKTSDVALTQQGTLLGTPMYMSPEQAAGNHAALDARSDIYSLGLIFYELMTLRHPLEKHATSIEAILAALDGPSPTLGAIKLVFASRGAPCEYSPVIRRAMEKDPGARYGSIEEMTDEIRSIQGGCIAISCHVTFTKRATSELIHFADRHPRWFTVGFAAAVVTLGFGGWALAMQLFHLVS